jgi:hypothetical protein
MMMVEKLDEKWAVSRVARMVGLWVAERAVWSAASKAVL